MHGDIVVQRTSTSMARGSVLFLPMKPTKQGRDRTADPASTEGHDQRPLLNFKLHLRLMLEGGARPSTLESAMAALHRIRRRREAEAQGVGQ